METLRGVFPALPTEALLRVLEVCDQSVAMASTWLLENDWQDLMDEADAEDQEEEEEDEEAASPIARATQPGAAATDRDLALDSTTALEQARTMVVSTEVQAASGDGREQLVMGPFFARRSVTEFPFHEEFDSEDEDDAAEGDEGEDEDEDEEEDDMYYDSGDEGAFRVRGVTPLAKRIKITKSRERDEAKADDFWVMFDDQVVIKSMIELLNTTLSKLAHNKVVLLKQPAKELDEAAATEKLKSVLSPTVTASNAVAGGPMQSSRDASNRITVASLLNGSSLSTAQSGDEPSLTESPTITASEAPVGQKRKRGDEPAGEESPRQGFFAYFFPVRELDMVWRTVLHAHLFKSRFGEKIEFHTASGGPFSKRDFDELMHIQTSSASSRSASLEFSPLSMLKCCLIIPCQANEEEMFRVGRNIHGMLKVQGSLYYQMIETPPYVNAASPRNHDFELLNEDGKLTEERFRQFARYRVKEEESRAAETAVPSKVSGDPYMSYQQPRKTKYCLEVLDASNWTSRLIE